MKSRSLCRSRSAPRGGRRAPRPRPIPARDSSAGIRAPAPATCPAGEHRGRLHRSVLHRHADAVVLAVRGRHPSSPRASRPRSTRGPHCRRSTCRSGRRAGIQAILDAAIEPGSRTGPTTRTWAAPGSPMRPRPCSPSMRDGVTHTVKVYALGEWDPRPAGMSPDEYAARRALSDSSAKLATLEALAPGGSVGPPRPSCRRRPPLRQRLPARPQLTEPGVAWPLDPPSGLVRRRRRTRADAMRRVTGEDWTGTPGPAGRTGRTSSPRGPAEGNGTGSVPPAAPGRVRLLESRGRDLQEILRPNRHKRSDRDRYPCGYV